MNGMLAFIISAKSPEKVAFLARLFRYVSDGSIQWADMGEVYDRIRFGDEVFNFVRGKAAFSERLKSAFPDREDCEAIDQYIDIVRAAAREARGFSLKKPYWRLRPR